MTGSRSAPLAGRYVLIDQIGVGGMGSVWRAWDRRSRRFVAAKVLGQHGGDLLLRFVREQSIRIQHPHVVAPDGWAADDDLVLFTMDLVRGGSLQALLDERGALPPGWVAVVLDQVLEALAAIHAAGVVHRDIKPANLLLEVTGTGLPHVRVGDFGVATRVDDVRLTRVPGAVGTDGYLAPEQVRGATPDPRQDLYAVGVVARQMLTGRPPGRPGPRHAAATGRLTPLLDALTDPDPERRPPSAPAALAHLRRLAGAGEPARPGDPAPPVVVDRLGDVEVPGGATATTIAIGCCLAALLLGGIALHLLLR